MLTVQIKEQEYFTTMVCWLKTQLTKMMSALGGQLVILPSFLCVFLVLLLIKIFHKLWWTPTRLQKLMALQGITGPPYRFIHGNTKEITDMIKEAMSRPKNLSHDVFSVVQPHIHSWTQIYGNKRSRLVNYFFKS